MNFPQLIFKAADGPPALPDVDVNVDVPVDDGLPSEAPAADAILCEDCLAEGRTTVLTWGGRGRKPRKCDDHKKGARKSTSQTRTPRGRSFDRRLQSIKDDLLEGVGTMAGTVVGIAPVTATTMAMQGPDTIDALLSLAERYPKMLDGLEAAAQAVPFAQIARFGAAIALAVAVDMHRMAPYGIAAEMLGVAAAAQHAGWQPPQPQHSVMDMNVEVDLPPPPAFKM